MFLSEFPTEFTTEFTTEFSSELPTVQSNTENNSGIDPLITMGSSVGGFFFLMVVGFMVFFLVKRYQRNKSEFFAIFLTLTCGKLKCAAIKLN